jgi:hypothetical protein
MKSLLHRYLTLTLDAYEVYKIEREHYLWEFREGLATWSECNREAQRSCEYRALFNRLTAFHRYCMLHDLDGVTIYHEAQS